MKQSKTRKLSLVLLSLAFTGCGNQAKADVESSQTQPDVTVEESTMPESDKAPRRLRRLNIQVHDILTVMAGRAPQ